MCIHIVNYPFQLSIILLNLFYQPELTSKLQLSAEEAHHAIHVLRHQVGDLIRLTDGKGSFAKARIEQLTKSECHCQLLEKVVVPQRPYSIHLAIAPTKSSDRMEWMVEKCVEIGVDQISFITCRHSERKKTNFDRIQKIIVSAMKQSQQAWLPVLRVDVPFSSIVNEQGVEKFIAHVDERNPNHLLKSAQPRSAYLVLIGPEGDFSNDELVSARDHGFAKVSLGQNRLRTETAGLVAVQTLHLLNV